MFNGNSRPMEGQYGPKIWPKIWYYRTSIKKDPGITIDMCICTGCLFWYVYVSCTLPSKCQLPSCQSLETYLFDLGIRDLRYVPFRTTMNSSNIQVYNTFIYSFMIWTWLDIPYFCITHTHISIYIIYVYNIIYMCINISISHIS